MKKIVSIQGSMASGKTSICRYLEEHLKEYRVVYEDIGLSVKQVKKLNLNKKVEKEYYEIQRIFITNILKKHQAVLMNHDKIIYDLGPEDIEFYTLNYPKAIGANWEVERFLENELTKLRKCRPDLTIFLNLPVQVLKKRKISDKNRNRSFFNFYIENLHPLKIDWYQSKKNVIFLDIENKSIDETGEIIVDLISKINFPLIEST